MRWCRIRLILLGLLLCVVHVVTGTCGQRFTDPASSALLSDVVIEAKVRQIHNHGQYQTYNITVAIRKSILKGSQFVNNGMPIKKVTIARFKNGGVDLQSCVASVKVGRTYFFFLRDISHHKGLHFEIMAMPVRKTKSMASTLRRILCESCAQKPTISKLTGPDSLPVGAKATLSCAAEAKPNPVFSWYKDGVLLPALRKERVRIRSRKRQSALQIKNVKQSDAGEYECVASNAMGQASRSFTIKVRLDISASLPLTYTTLEEESTTVIDPVEKMRVLCPVQSLCLNGGTCVYIPALTDQFCQCPEQWVGRRCELLDAISVREDYNHQASLLFGRTLIIIGIVIAVLVFIIICIASYILATKRRKRYEERRRRREQISAQTVDKTKSQTKTNKERDNRSENLTPDLAPRQQHLIKLQNSSLPPAHQQSDVKLDPHGQQLESRRRLAACSVYENVTESKPVTVNPSGDVSRCKSTEATKHTESIEMSVLQEAGEDINNLDTYDNDSNLISSNSSRHNVSMDLPLSLPSQSSHPLLSPSQLPQMYYQTTETVPGSFEHHIIPSEPTDSSSFSSFQPITSHQQFQDDASSRDDNDLSVQPLLENHKIHYPIENYEHRARPFESKSDRDLSRYVLLGSKRQTDQDSQESGIESGESNRLLTLSHSNTFPASKLNGVALDMYSESDDEEYDVEVPYEKQLHISEEDLRLSEEALVNSTFLIVNRSSRHTTREDLVLGLLPNSYFSRPGMRKYQSEDGPAYSKLGNKNFAFLELSVRSRSLDDPTPTGDDSPNPMRLNSTMAGSPDVDTYDNITQSQTQIHNVCGYDPNDDSVPWDRDLSRSDFSNLTTDDRDEQNRLKDLVPDQQPIPI